MTGDGDYEERAARRRARWRGGVADSYGAMEEADLDFWQAATGAERVAATTLLLAELHHLEGTDGPPPGLLRSVGGVRVVRR